VRPDRILVLAAAGALALAATAGVPARAGNAAQPAAPAPTAEAPLSRGDVCALARAIATRLFPGKPGSSLVEQPCTRELAGLHESLAADIQVGTAGVEESWRRPLDLGDTCGGGARASRRALRGRHRSSEWPWNG
jgi:hypothetical protein